MKWGSGLALQACAPYLTGKAQRGSVSVPLIPALCVAILEGVRK